MLVSFGINAAEPEASSPEEIVHTTTEKVLEVLDKDAKKLKHNPQEVQRLMDQMLTPVIDFEAFSKLTLGHNWKKASPDQRKRFVKEFKGMLLRTYTKHLVDYAGTSIKVVPNKAQQTDPRRRLVLTEVSLSGKPPLGINYSFWFNKSKWKAYNVTVDGLSLVHLFRTDFTREISQTSLDALIKRLANTNREASTGKGGGSG
jgi:phospholipid transport system substrate-binding protein